VADYITGFAAACFRKSKKTKSGGLSSKVGFFGIMKKVMMFVAIIVAHQVDIVVSNGANTIRDIITGCLIANEALSFYENVALFGVPFPKKLRRILDQLRDPEDDPPSNTNGMKESG
jgi:toxin secretion/phage lysis holin